MFDYAGAFHIHSSYSFDGNTSPGAIVAAARRCGLDFIVLTDHFRLDAKTDGWEGWHDGVFVLVGEEISPRYNHYLALGIDHPIVTKLDDVPPQEYIDAVRAQNGMGLIAHPDHTGAPLFGVQEYPWNDWSVQGFDGVSIWDLMTDWQEKLASLPRALLAYVLPSKVLSGPKAATLERWDRLNESRRVAGYGEIDNHNTRKRVFGIPFRIFPFNYAFKTIRTHALLDHELSADTTTAKQQLLAAIHAARLYVAQEYWRSSKGFLFRVYDDTTTVFTGDEFTLGQKPVLLEAKIPGPGLLRLVRNGAAIKESAKEYLYAEIREPGTYRIEAWQQVYGTLRPWIFSNHIKVIPGSR